jgi:phospholipase/carboxylesterase
MTEATGSTLDGPRVSPASGGSPRQLVVFLHGVGADGNDLIQIAPLLRDLLPDAAFVSPDAPYPFDMAPTGRQWFSFRDDSAAAINRAVVESAPHFDRFLDAELARTGLDASRVALIGFSQGGMIALQSALRRDTPVAALLALSTVLPNAESLPRDLASKPPVLMIHGDQDQVLPVNMCHQSTMALEAAGVPVSKHILAGRGHEIDQEALSLMRDFLGRHLAAR